MIKEMDTTQARSNLAMFVEVSPGLDIRYPREVVELIYDELQVPLSLAAIIQAHAPQSGFNPDYHVFKSRIEHRRLSAIYSSGEFPRVDLKSHRFLGWPRYVSNPQTLLDRSLVMGERTSVNMCADGTSQETGLIILQDLEHGLRIPSQSENSDSLEMLCDFNDTTAYLTSLLLRTTA